ncbi:response regulator [Paenibacillus sp. JSM ZJ436]|uniref:Two component transcriptional regulator, AraC family n=1 Tax=Paenibacillus algicola TaxID=2565926 RepID=A0A4P8XH73_9BACL|nr:response regulator [Paenibacillus algicola]QCT01513.1 two component transcriptional regulator, AraC family [Paenibacillus algicola]
MREQIKILVVEDEDLTRNGVVKALLNYFGSEIIVDTAENGIEALDKFEEKEINLLITDIKMPEMDGISLLEILNQSNKECMTIVLTGHAEFEYAQKSIAYGVFDYILKPVNPKVLYESVQKAITKFSELKKMKTNLKLVEQHAGTLHPIHTSKNRIIQYITEYVMENLDKQLTLKEISELVHMNPNYLSGLFKAETGELFSEFILKIRLYKAKELLAQTDMKIYEVAEAVGYQTSRYFNRIFQEHEQKTPNEFRKLFRNN